nr:immunoglobulin light chain junction region [Macaca mulatta]
CMQVLEYPWTF